MTHDEIALLWRVKRYCLDMEDEWRNVQPEIDDDEIYAAGVVAGVRLVALHIGRMIGEVPEPQVKT